MLRKRPRERVRARRSSTRSTGTPTSRVQRGRDRRRPRVGDRPRGKPPVQVGVVRSRRLQVLPRHRPVESLHPVDHRRVHLERHPERQPFPDDRRHERLLLRDPGLLLDDRGDRHDLVHREARHRRLLLHLRGELSSERPDHDLQDLLRRRRSSRGCRCRGRDTLPRSPRGSPARQNGGEVAASRNLRRSASEYAPSERRDVEEVRPRAHDHRVLDHVPADQSPPCLVGRRRGREGVFPVVQPPPRDREQHEPAERERVGERPRPPEGSSTISGKRAPLRDGHQSSPPSSRSGSESKRRKVETRSAAARTARATPGTVRRGRPRGGGHFRFRRSRTLWRRNMAERLSRSPLPVRPSARRTR